MKITTLNSLEDASGIKRGNVGNFTLHSYLQTARLIIDKTNYSIYGLLSSKTRGVSCRYASCNVSPYLIIIHIEFFMLKLDISWYIHGSRHLRSIAINLFVIFSSRSIDSFFLTAYPHRSPITVISKHKKILKKSNRKKNRVTNLQAFHHVRSLFHRNDKWKTF